MPTTKLKAVVDRAKTILQETGAEGVRWTNAELVDWANEFYCHAANLVPSEFAEVREMNCVAGTKQDAPADMVQVIDVIRNLDGSMMPLTATAKDVLDSTIRGWHGHAGSIEQEVFVLDERYPRNFYVYPPASVGSKIEIAGAVIPVAHVLSDFTGEAALVKCSDRITPAMTDYILFRAHNKDAEHAGNAARSDYHRNLCDSFLTKGKITRNQVSSGKK